MTGPPRIIYVFNTTHLLVPTPKGYRVQLTIQLPTGEFREWVVRNDQYKYIQDLFRKTCAENGLFFLVSPTFVPVPGARLEMLSPFEAQKLLAEGRAK